MLTDEQVAEVRGEWLKAFSRIKRGGMDAEGLIAELDSIGFFDAPASTKYHCAFKGGLALHSLNVAREMYKMVRADAAKGSGDGEPEEAPKMAFGEDSILIAGLFHDVAKASMYEPFAKNEKAYSANGSKQDGLGRFDWVSTLSYRVRESSSRDSVGTRGFAAYWLVSKYIPLTDEEAFALVNQCSPGEDFQGNLADVFAKHNLAAYLNAADVVATYCIEHD